MNKIDHISHISQPLDYDHYSKVNELCMFLSNIHFFYQITLVTKLFPMLPLSLLTFSLTHNTMCHKSVLYQELSCLKFFLRTQKIIQALSISSNSRYSDWRYASEIQQSLSLCSDLTYYFEYQFR